MKNFVVALLLLCTFAANSFAANDKPNTAKNAANAETVAVEETATAGKNAMVGVREMPANANGETAVRNVAVPEAGIGGFRQTEKPSVKDSLPEFPKPGFFARLAIGGVLFIALEIVKFLALLFVVVWLLRHFWPKAAATVEGAAKKVGARTGTNIVGSVGDAVSKFDAIVDDLRAKHKAHSDEAALADSRLSKIAPPAKKKAGNGT